MLNSFTATCISYLLCNTNLIGFFLGCGDDDLLGRLLAGLPEGLRLGGLSDGCRLLGGLPDGRLLLGGLSEEADLLLYGLLRGGLSEGDLRLRGGVLVRLRGVILLLLGDRLRRLGLELRLLRLGGLRLLGDGERLLGDGLLRSRERERDRLFGDLERDRLLGDLERLLPGLDERLRFDFCAGDFDLYGKNCCTRFQV